MKTTITQNLIFRTFSRLQRSCFSAVFLLLFLLSASSSWGQTTVTETISTSGLGLWICPPGVTSITVTCRGAGGGGGGVGPYIYHSAGGGQGGAYVQAPITVVPGQTYQYEVGVRGSASDNADGGNGGDTYFTSVILAKGGAGGKKPTSTSNGSSSAYQIGAGATAITVGNVVPFGGTSSYAPAGGQGANSGSGAGSNGATSGGLGGNSIAADGNNDGNDGIAPGGGGSGGYSRNDNGQSRGGRGGDGRIIITYTTSNSNTFFRSRATGDWNQIATWQVSSDGVNYSDATAGQLPSANSKVIINNNHTVTITAGPVSCSDLTFASGNNNSNLLLGSNTLSVTGGVSIQPSTSDDRDKLLNVQTGILNCAGIYIATTAHNSRDLEILLSTGTINVTGNIVMNGASDRNAIRFSGAGTLNVGGNFNQLGSLVTFLGSTVNYNGGDQTARVDTYLGNVTLSGSSVKTFATTPTINGVLSMEGTATISIAPTYGAAATLRYNTSTARTAGVEWITPFAATGGINVINTGAITNANTVTVSSGISGSGTLINTGTLNASGNISVTTLSNSGILNRSGSGTTTTALANFTNTGTLNLGGSGTIAGITNNAAGIVNLASSGTITAFVNATATSTLNISALSVPTFTTLTTSVVGNTVNYTGAGAQTVRVNAYSNLGLSGSGAKTFAGLVTASANLSIAAGVSANLGTLTTHTANSLTLGVLGTLNGSWGSTTATTAQFKNNTFFGATTGIVTVNSNTAATPTVTVTPIGTYTYNGSAQGPNAATNSGDSTSSYTYSYVGVSPTNYTASATRPTNAGSYTVTATVSNSPNGFWRSASSDATAFSIAAKTLTVTATGPSKTYGTALAVGISSTNFTAGSTLVGSETVTSVTLTPNAAGLSSTTAAGSTYVVTPSAATGTGGFLASNYNITYTPFNGTVTAASLTITASNSSKCFGTTYTLGTSAFTPSGLQNGETIGSVTLTSEGAASNGSVGTHPIVISSATGVNFIASNYNITYTSGTLTVNALPTATWASTATAVCYSNSAQETSLAYSATTASPTSYSITWSATTPANSFAAVSNQSFNGTSSGGTISIAIPAGTDPGTYTGTITVKNANSCTSSAVQTFTVTVNAPNQATATSTNTCGTATLVANGGSASATWYSDALGTTPVTTSGNITVSSPATTSTLTIVNPTASTTYYAYTFANGCRSQNNREAAVELKYTNQFQGVVTYTNDPNPVEVIPSWFDAGNWTCGIPTANSNVVIPNGKVSVAYTPNQGPAYANTVTLEGTASLTVTSDHSINVTNKVTVASGATFTVQNNASLVQTDDVTNEGNITVQKSTPSNRLLKRFDAVLWSSPVVQSLLAVSPTTAPAYFMEHNPQANSWSAVSNLANANFTEAKGFLVRTPASFPATATQQWNVNFTGVPNNGNVTISAGSTGTSEKYLLVGNPYPSAISIAAFRAANPNITGVFYFFRKPNGVTGISSYGTLDASNTFVSNDNSPNSAGAVSPGSVIPSGQGFFVAMKSNDNNGEVKFTNAMRVANNHGTFNRMNTNLDTYRLLVQTPVGGNSQFITNYDAETTSGYDVGYDAIAFTDGTTDLSMIMNAKNYRIQSRGQYNAADVIPVQFKTGTAGEHRIKLQDAQGVFAADQMVIIKDNLTGVQHNLTANGDYVFTASAGTFTNRFEVVYQQAYYTALQANSCGATIANMSSLVYADLINGATGYRFKVVNNTTAAVQTIDRPQHWFAFNMLSAYDYNTPYTISVQVQKDGVWTGYYGTTCTVNSPNIAATGVMQINPSQCGATLATLGTVIATTPVAGATGYKFRITNTTANASGTNMVQEITRSNHWFTLGMLSRYNYGSSYTVEVAVKTTGAFTPYGNACTVYSPSAPTLASCGQTVATATTLVRTTAMTLATQYRFQVTRMSTQETITFDTANFWFSFRVNVPGYAAGEQYGVRVAVMTAGSWSPYGDACDITAPIASARTTEEASPSEANLFKPVAYPNPFASTFGISLATPSADVVHVMVYDLQGRLIEKQNIFVSQLDSLQIGTNYPSGDYLLVVAQGANIKSSHIHKD